jgi:hypothetical protein
VAFHDAGSQALFAFWQVCIPKRYNHFSAWLSLLFAIGLYELEQLAALNDFGAKRHLCNQVKGDMENQCLI